MTAQSWTTIPFQGGSKVFPFWIPLFKDVFEYTVQSFVMANALFIYNTLKTFQLFSGSFLWNRWSQLQHRESYIMQNRQRDTAPINYLNISTSHHRYIDKGWMWLKIHSAQKKFPTVCVWRLCPTVYAQSLSLNSLCLCSQASVDLDSSPWVRCWEDRHGGIDFHCRRAKENKWECSGFIMPESSCMNKTHSKTFIISQITKTRNICTFCLLPNYAFFLRMFHEQTHTHNCFFNLC